MSRKGVRAAADLTASLFKPAQLEQHPERAKPLPRAPHVWIDPNPQQTTEPPELPEAPRAPCLAIDCAELADPRWPCCWTHWAMLPPDLREQEEATRDKPPKRAAILRAITGTIAMREGKTLPAPARVYQDPPDVAGRIAALLASLAPDYRPRVRPYDREGEITAAYVAQLRPGFLLLDSWNYDTCLHCNGGLAGLEQREGLHPQCVSPYLKHMSGMAKEGEPKPVKQKPTRPPCVRGCDCIRCWGDALHARCVQRDKDRAAREQKEREQCQTKSHPTTPPDDPS